MSLTKQELQTQLEDARKALEALEEQERRAELERRRAQAVAAENERKERVAARRRSVLKTIVTAIRELGVKIDDDGTVPGVPDADVGFVEEHRRVNSFKSGPTGRDVVTVGLAFRRVLQLRFPPNSKGEYNIKKIALRVSERVSSAVLEDLNKMTEEKKLSDAKALALKVREDAKTHWQAGRIEAVYEVYYPVSPSKTERKVFKAPPGKVFVRAGAHIECTPEQALRLTALLEEILANPCPAEKR